MLSVPPWMAAPGESDRVIPMPDKALLRSC